MRRHRVALCLFCLALMLAPILSTPAHDYNRRYEHPVRYLAYPFYAAGIALEYTVFRPLHYIVSQPNYDVIFGHQASPNDEYWAWRVTD